MWTSRLRLRRFARCSRQFRRTTSSACWPNAETAFPSALEFSLSILTRLELDPRVREIAILNVARLSAAEYEWMQHEAIAQHVGVTREQVDAIERGELDAECLPARYHHRHIKGAREAIPRNVDWLSLDDHCDIDAALPGQSFGCRVERLQSGVTTWCPQPGVTDLRDSRKERMMRPARSSSDAELAAATPGDPQAFGELYRRHERAVLAYFLHWCRSPELAADLTAETFAAALGSLPSYESDRGEVRAWLFGIARHVLARSVESGRVEDEARRRLGMPAVLVDDETLERIEAIASLNGSALRLLDELPEPMRSAVSGRVVDEREYLELAQSLSCSQSVVRQRVRRGLARLRDQLEMRQ
jgi:RNA polymerase sigma-70 factor (ECF subfamily)